MSRKEGKQIIENAEQAGFQYAIDQTEGDYFLAWVREQMIEADRMRRRDPRSVIPLETKSDYRRLARNMLQTLEWDTRRQLDARSIFDMSGADRRSMADLGVTDRDVVGAFYEGFSARLREKGVVDWLADEVERVDRDMRPKSRSSRRPAHRPQARESHRVNDYTAFDSSGRPVAGPFTNYGDAKRAADRAHGYVKFSPSGHETAGRAPVTRRRNPASRPASPVSSPPPRRRRLG